MQRKKKASPPQNPLQTAAHNWKCDTAKRPFFPQVHNNSAFVEESFKCHKPEQEGFRPYKNVGLALRAIFEELTFRHLQKVTNTQPKPIHTFEVYNHDFK